MSDEESHSESEFYYPKDEEQAKTEHKNKGHIVNNLLTSSIRSLQGNLRPRPGCIDLAIALSIHQGLGLRFPCNDLTLG